MSDETTPVVPEKTKAKKELTQEEKDKLAADRKEKDAARLQGAKDLFGVAAKVKSVDAKKVIFGASKYKVTPGELADMLTAGTIAPEDEVLIRELKLVKTYTTKATGDELPYNWPSFRDYTEGESGDKELEKDLVTLSGLVDKFYEDNNDLLASIEELTKKNQTRLGEPTDECNGAILMNYFRFPKPAKKKEETTAEPVNPA